MALNTILSAILELSSVDMWYGFASVLPEYKNPRSRLHWGGIPGAPTAAWKISVIGPQNLKCEALPHRQYRRPIATSARIIGRKGGRGGESWQTGLKKSTGRGPCASVEEEQHPPSHAGSPGGCVAQRLRCEPTASHRG